MQNNELSIDDAESLIKIDYLDKLDEMVQLDIFRQARTGIPEVIFAQSKTTSQVVKITQTLLEKNHYVIVTRTTPPQRDVLAKQYGSNSKYKFELNEPARIIVIKEISYQFPQISGKVGIISAGTSDIPVADEARVVLEAMGIQTKFTYDVGISGMHRIFPPIKEMLNEKVDVFIVVAGMEGTLPGVVSALVDKPVIGVPTSIGYGLGEKGIGALTTMLQSCSPGLAVVNIDNGFGAATFASLVVKGKNI
jgi:hypothetical protein